MANIKLNNNEYPIPDSVLAGPKAALIAHLGTITGGDIKVIIDGVEYGIDSTKVVDVFQEIETTFEELSNFVPPVETWDISATVSDNVTAKLYNDLDNAGKYSLVISGNGNMIDYTSSSIPPWRNDNYVNKLISVIVLDGVTNIGNRAFCECSWIRSITISDTVTSIGAYAFRSCSDLQSITIPNSVTSIGEGAFNASNLTSIVLPNSITNISERAFESCSSLQSIIIPNSVTNISNGAFNACTGLTSITIPNSITNMGANIFANCSHLTSIEFDGTVAQWNAINKPTFINTWHGGNVPATHVQCSDGQVAI